MTKKLSIKDLQKIATISLDVACGENKQEGWIGMDARNLTGVDIVHEPRDIPWPIPTDCVNRLLVSHCLEHFQNIMPVMAEIHRVCKHKAAVFISVPYWQSLGAWQDPTHVRCFNEHTFYYFDDRSPLWATHKPPIFRVKEQTFQFTGNIETILEVIKDRDEEDGEEAKTE